MTRPVAEIEADIRTIDRKHATLVSEAADVFRSAGIDSGAPDAYDQLAAKHPGKYEAVERYRAGLAPVLAQRGELLAELATAREADLEARRARIAELAKNPANVELPFGHKDPTMTTPSVLPGGRAQLETAALRAVEQLVYAPRAQDRLDAVIRDTRTDPLGLGPAYLAAVARPEYLSAFGRILANPSFAHLEMTPAEQDAVRGVRQAMDMQAAALGYGTTGGFGVPFTLDPTIMLTDAGDVSPLRQLARVVTIATNEWRGVSSDAVEATYQAEFAEVADNSPTLAQPTIVTDKAQAWIEFGVEVGQDWPGLQAELARLLAEGKANVEAEKFTNGDGHASSEPEGIYAGLDVTSIAANTHDLAALYTVQEALPAKYSANATWLMNIAAVNTSARFVGSGDASEPQIFSGDGSRLLRKPWAELSTLPAGIVLYGDIRAAFTIVDRIGMTIELVPHVLGNNRRPTGKRGLYAYWRNSSEIVNDNALRAIAPAGS